MSKQAAQTKLGKLAAFIVAGGTGFVIDITILYVLLNFTPMGPYLARLISVICAMISNFFINRTFTFGHSDRTLGEEFLRYLSIAAVGLALNYIIYAALLYFIDGFSPFLATFIAVITVAFFSYFGYSRFVFNRD